MTDTTKVMSCHSSQFRNKLWHATRLK